MVKVCERLDNTFLAFGDHTLDWGDRHITRWLEEEGDRDSESATPMNNSVVGRFISVRSKRVHDIAYVDDKRTRYWVRWNPGSIFCLHWAVRLEQIAHSPCKAPGKSSAKRKVKHP
jgi:hypothetical protein